jgi:hypothetical protein
VLKLHTGDAQPSSEAQSRHAPTSGEVFEKLLSIDQLLAAVHGCVTRYTVYRWVRSGLPAVKLGGQLYFEPSKAFPWIERKARV